MPIEQNSDKVKEDGVMEIIPQEDGPLEITGVSNFRNSRNETIQTKKTMYLCRCGASKSKPFCDGNHSNIDFKTANPERSIPDKRESYKGKEITIHDNRGICAHAGYCTDNLSSVFKMGTEPWIDPDGAKVEEIRKVIETCPSGALSYSILDEKNQFTEINEYYQKTKNSKENAEVSISKNGPYLVQDFIELKNVSLGDGASKEHYALCRCGASQNKPRCDGAHWYAAFKDDEALTISRFNKNKKKNQSTKADSSNWIKVAEKNEIINNIVTKITVRNRQIAVTKVDGIYGAIDAVCSHQGGPMAEGSIDEGKETGEQKTGDGNETTKSNKQSILCPWHGHKFDRITGKSLRGDEDLTSYKIKERDDGVYIEIIQENTTTWTISHLMAETMVNWGVNVTFGMVGHSNLGLAEAMRIQEEKGNMRYIGIRHEGAAAFAASGYAKVTGKPAACLTIAGPGATNLLTGLWDAKVDRAPVLALTGQIQTQVFGPGTFQEVDLASAFSAVSRFSHTVLPDSDHAELISLALKTAIIERDVSHLIFPDDVQTLDAGDNGPSTPDGRISQTAIQPSDLELNMAMYRLWAAKKPVIIVGHGARNAMKEVITLAENLKAPVITTFKAKGQIHDNHPLACGVLGKSGNPVSSYFMSESDLLIVFGASFSKHTGIDSTKPLIQVDFDRMALGKFHSIDSPVWGDIAVTSRLMNEKLGDYGSPQDQTKLIADKWIEWRKEKKRRVGVRQKNGISSAAIFEALENIAPSNAIYSVDVGNNTYSFGRYFECKDNIVIMSGYLGSIGFAFPAAMGAWMATLQSENELNSESKERNIKNRPVISISGDGGFGQYMSEFTTAIKYDMNITHILLNNGELGKISKEQRDSQVPVWQTDLKNPSFAEYANSCGGLGIKVEQATDLNNAISRAIEHKGPSLVEIISDPELT